MRFSELFLAEATLQNSTNTSWRGYLENMINSVDIALGKQGERASGLELTSKSKKVLTSLLKELKTMDNAPSPAVIKQMENLEVEFTDGTVAPLKHVFKSPEIRGTVNDSGSEKKPWNSGEISETILGAALYARFISKNNITENDVWNALKVFTRNVIPGGFEAPASKRNKKNPIRMTAINKPVNNLYIDKLVHNRAELSKEFPDGVKELEQKVKASAAYVNESSKVQAALEKADETPGAPITIKTDGVGDQRGTKADLQINVGSWVQLLSLKVNDVKQFGQDSGSSGSVITTFFQRFIPDIDLSDLYMVNGEPMPWTPETGEGWPDMDNKKAVKELKMGDLWNAALDQVYKLTGMAYQRAAALLQSKLTTEQGAADVVRNFYNGIIHHVQGNAQFQTLVILNPTSKIAWKELEFGPDLEQALGHYKLEVSVEIGQRGISNHKLRIWGTPNTPESVVASQLKIDSKAEATKAKKKVDAGNVPTSAPKELLLQLRSYQQASGNMRNPVEMGPLLKDLTEVQKIEDLPALSSVEKASQAKPKVAPATQQATTTATPAPTAPVAQQGQPSGMTSIAPTMNTVDTTNDMEPENPSELDRIRKNAGITVE